MSDWYLIALGIVLMLLAVRILVGGAKRRQDRRARAHPWVRWTYFIPARFDAQMAVLTALITAAIGVYLVVQGLA